MTITLLHQVANDPEGAVLDVDERRATRLIRTGYARPVTVAMPAPVQSSPKRKKEA